MSRGLWEPERLFPPGYEYRGERNAAALLLLLAAAYSFFRFLGALCRALGELYVYADGKWMLRQEMLEAGGSICFKQLAEGNWRLCLPFFLFLPAMAAVHYAFYYRGAKSIYLMRRLPGRLELIKSCAGAPVLGGIFGAACMAALQTLYYVIYLLAVPAAYRP